MDVMSYDVDDHMLMENGAERLASKRQRVEAGPSTSSGWAT